MLELAQEELTNEQREIFVAQEPEGRSFKELSTLTSLPLFARLITLTMMMWL